MQEFMFKMVDDETYGIAGYTGDEKDVVIPPVYNGQPVTMLLDDLFKGHSEIVSVRIPDTVTDIGGFVFDGCTGLSALELPPALRYMWQYAFARCGIREITIPEKVKDIVPFAFKDCKQLEKVVCSPGLKEISAWAFQGCTKLRPENVICGQTVKTSPQAFG